MPRGVSKAKPPGVKGTLGVIAIALGVGLVGAFALDYHAHTCESCGAKWKHLGAFNAGDVGAHACPSCGSTQWWKDGFPRGPIRHT